MPVRLRPFGHLFFQFAEIPVDLLQGESQGEKPFHRLDRQGPGQPIAAPTPSRDGAAWRAISASLLAWK